MTVFGAIVAASVRTRLAAGLPDPLHSLPPETLTDLTSPNLLTDPGALARTRRQVEAVTNPDVFDALLQTLRSALATGLSQVFVWTAVTAAVALVVTALLPQNCAADLRWRRLEIAPLQQIRPEVSPCTPSIEWPLRVEGA